MRNIHTFFACICCLPRRFYLPLQTYNHKKSSCARTDLAVQKVESGKFNKITLNEDFSSGRAFSNLAVSKLAFFTIYTNELSISCESNIA